MPVTEGPTGVPSPTGVPAALERARAGAEAAILARLWGALAREPLPGIAGREVRRGTVTVRWSDGTRVTGDAAMSRPFAAPPPGFAVAVTTPVAPRPEEIRDPGTLIRTLAHLLGRHAARLATELDNSVANLALARAGQPEPDGGEPMLVRAARQPDPLAFLEQSVVDGHPVHPGARTRLGLSADEVRAYAPEHRPAPVRLRAVAVPPDRWYGVGCPPQLWLHPWQHERVRHEHPWLSTVEEEIPARPLLALRTLAVVDDPCHHVKTSVDIQMTSAVRTVSPASIHNGHVLSPLMTAVRTRHPGLEMVPELAGGAVIVDGEPSRRLAMIHRRMPALAPGELALPLAALTAPSLATGAPIVLEIVAAGYHGDPLSFVEHVADVLLRPVVSLLATGIALEAHGQNVLGVFRGGRLVRLLYRDVGGVRVSARRLREHGIEPPPLRGDIPSDDPDVLRTKVFASAVSTLLGEMIAVLARHTELEADRAWQRVAAVARTLDGPDVPLLFTESLPIKAMTAMRLADDATADLWCPVPNPMAGLG
ncbi:MAG: IucA/IucC family siderophore biosynthesis protein [Micromonosporaceae bacterium]|nr:IucA/IucC family siderophore biosynthesis protein [Micromonosporaceae bacterium]